MSSSSDTPSADPTTMAPTMDAEMLLAYALGDQIGTAICATCGGLMVPIAVVFLLFSTPRTRRQPLFWIQIVSLVLAISAAYIELASYSIDARQRYQGSMTYARLQIAKEYPKWLAPWTADVALLFRLSIFYPTALYSFRKRATMIGFPAILKLPRLVCIFVNLGYVTSAVESNKSTWFNLLRFQIVELTMQMVDNVYVSTFLLFKSFQFSRKMSVNAGNRTQRRARLIIESVFMSFVPALFLQIVLVVMYGIVVASKDPYKLNVASSALFTFHVFLNVILSLMATSWSSICNTAVANRITSTTQSRKKGQEIYVRRVIRTTNDTDTTNHCQSDSLIYPTTASSCASEKRDGAVKMEHTGSSAGSVGKAILNTQPPRHEDAKANKYNDPAQVLAIGTRTQLLQHGIDPCCKPEDWTLLRYLTQGGSPEFSPEHFYYDAERCKSKLINEKTQRIDEKDGQEDKVIQPNANDKGDSRASITSSNAMWEVQRA